MITGGSSGIGRLMAEKFAKEKATVVIWARDRKAIDETGGCFLVLALLLLLLLYFPLPSLPRSPKHQFHEQNQNDVSTPTPGVVVVVVVVVFEMVFVQ